ncbi:MAG: pilus assembly PilX N-terminal domain-containing protein [Sedimentisphaerales bacterium]|nr:pilus assembly PilX N-terminal domain-containing protein [Sedimentisphaerales bacterium]
MIRIRYRRGAALVLCLIFMVVLLAFGASLAAMSGANVQMAANQQQTGRAFAAAESGLEVMRYWLGHVAMAHTITSQAARWDEIVHQVQDALDANNVTNVVLATDGKVADVPLNEKTGQRFSAVLSMADADTLVVAVTGRCGDATRTISVGFTIASYQWPIFNFGLATKGPIHFPNNPTTTTVTSNWEADIYTDSASLQAVYVGGNANFDGDISLGGAGADVDFASDVQIAGETGETAIENHVHKDADPVEFPAPDTDRFVPYATNTVEPNMLSQAGLTLTNATIPAGMNPTFGGTVNILGILLIEQPNVVTFAKNVTLEGMIVSTAPSTFTGGNKINVQGNFASLAFPSGSEFDGIRTQEGTAILTPGFDVSFTGNYSSIEGVVAADGLYFSGNASATIHGSLLSYSENPTVVEGNVSLTFDRAGSVKIPAGFDTLRVLEYDATSYAMN